MRARYGKAKALTAQPMMWSRWCELDAARDAGVAQWYLKCYCLLRMFLVCPFLGRLARDPFFIRRAFSHVRLHHAAERGAEVFG
jgi:hypothetical protein